MMNINRCRRIRAPKQITNLPTRSMGILDVWMWMSRFQGSKRSHHQPFHQITDKEIESEQGFSAEVVYRNNLFWMPRFY